MKISELLVFEAIGTVGASTDPLKQDGLPKTGNNPSAQSQQQNTQTTPQTPQQNTQSQPVQGQPSQQGQPGQPMGQNPTQTPAQGTAQNQAQTAQQQQSLQASMTDLDKIAAQIVGLKQKQQDLQKQLKTPAV